MKEEKKKKKRIFFLNSQSFQISASIDQKKKKIKIKMENLPGLPKKTEEYKTPLRAASFAAARASDEDDQSLRGHHLPEIIEKKKKIGLMP